MLRFLIYESKTDEREKTYILYITQSSVTWAEMKENFPILKGYKNTDDIIMDNVVFPSQLLNCLHFKKEDKDKILANIKTQITKLSDKQLEESEDKREFKRVLDCLHELEKETGLLRVQLAEKETEISALNKKYNVEM